jgi:hypothetical protein
MIRRSSKLSTAQYLETHAAIISRILRESAEAGLNQQAGIGLGDQEFRFNVKDLVAHAAQYPVQKMDPQTFHPQVAEAGAGEDPSTMKRRSAQADLSHPIIVVKSGDHHHIADGTHRARKAIAQNEPHINARVIPIEHMAKFKVPPAGDPAKRAHDLGYERAKRGDASPPPPGNDMAEYTRGQQAARRS